MANNEIKDQRWRCIAFIYIELGREEFNLAGLRVRIGFTGVECFGEDHSDNALGKLLDEWADEGYFKKSGKRYKLTPKARKEVEEVVELYDYGLTFEGVEKEGEAKYSIPELEEIALKAIYKQFRIDSFTYKTLQEKVLVKLHKMKGFDESWSISIGAPKLVAKYLVEQGYLTTAGRTRGKPAYKINRKNKRVREIFK